MPDAGEVATATHWFSLRRRLLGGLLGGVCLAWLVAIGLSYAGAHHEVDELFDAQLQQVADTLLAIVGSRHEPDEDDITEIRSAHHAYQQSLRFVVRDATGAVVVRSAMLTPAFLARHTVGDSEGFFSEREDHENWRYVGRWSPAHSLHVLVGDRHAPRERIAMEVATRMLVPALVGLPMLALWIWFVTRRELGTLDTLTGQLAHRDAERLEPLEPASAPAEIRPLLGEINALLARLRLALVKERRFTADAAHELRTPLAAIALQTQAASRARDTFERARALAQLEIGTARASHLLDQLLLLARLDAGVALPAEKRAVCRLDSLLVEVAAAHGAAAVEKNIDFGIDSLCETHVPGESTLLRVLLRNLIDNAVRYTPTGGKVQLTLAQDDRHAVLMVDDTGPGIAPEQRTAAMDRFVRLEGNDAAGSGLGLAIVARIVQVHGGSIELCEGPPSTSVAGGHGLCVLVRLPRVAAAAAASATGKDTRP